MRIEPASQKNLADQLATANHQLELIKMVTDELVSELDLDKLLILVARKAQDLIQSETLVVPILNDQRDHYTYKAAEGKNASLIMQQTFPVNVGMCGWVLSNKKPLIFGEGLPWLMDEKTTWEQGMESALLVPLMARGEIVGGLSGLGKIGGASFTQQDYDILDFFAKQVSVAIDNARIFEELTEEKERSETTLTSIGDAVITTDIDGVIVRVNPVACDMLGWQKHELIGQLLTRVFKIYNSDTGDVVEDPVEKVISSGEIVELAYHTVLVGRNGNEYQIADTAAPIRDSQNNLLGVVLVFHDVTEEYNLLSELRESEQKHRRLIENLSDEFFMFIQNASGEFSYISPSVQQSLGYSPQEFIQGFQGMLTDNEINNNIELRFNEVINGQKPAPYEIELKNKQGQFCYLRVTETPVFGADKKVIAIEGLVQNITVHRGLEQTLRQSQKMDAVGKLSGGIAHDFNNQLGVVIGYLDILKENTNADSEEARWIKTATNASQRCVELTQNLLSFSRKKLIRKSQVNINESILALENIIKHSVTAAVELNIQLAAGISDVMIDDGEFQDVVLNLVINARDAMSEGGVLTIQTQNIHIEKEQALLVNSLSEGHYVKFSVIDNGAGMSEQTLEHVFEPFFTTKPVGQGTGLGMPMVFGFINRINGALDVNSVEGKGTRINLYLPHDSKQDVQGQVPDDVVHNKLKLPHGSENVLLVEDEEALRELAEEYLTGLGYNVYVAENGHQAVELLKQDLVLDLLFSDVVMPGGMDGFQLAVEARKIRPDIKILMATGYTSRNAAENSPSEIAENILYKPYSRTILAQRVRRVLDKIAYENITS